MFEFLYYLTPIAVAAVAIVLLLGILNLARAGSSNTSQKLMRWRIILQFVALVVIMLAIWVKGP